MHRTGSRRNQAPASLCLSQRRLTDLLIRVATICNSQRSSSEPWCPGQHGGMTNHHVADPTQPPAAPDIRLIPCGPKPPPHQVPLFVWTLGHGPKMLLSGRRVQGLRGFLSGACQGPDLSLECAACGQPRSMTTVLYTQQNS